MTNLYRAIIKSMGSKYLAYAVQFASLMVLARLFTPETFGLVAAVQVFYVFFQLVAEGGLGPAIIGLRRMESTDRDGIYGLTVFSGIALSIGFFLISPLLVHFYQMPRLSVVVPYIALGLMFNAWSIVPTSLLQRQQSFFRLAIAGVIAEILALASILAIRGHADQLHALSLRLPLVALANFCLLYFFCRDTEFGRPHLGRRFSAIKPLLRVSGYQLAFNAVNFFSRNLDNILVGKYLGAPVLGIYDRSYQLMRYPLQLLTFAMTPAIQPVLRKHFNDPVFVRRVHDDLAFRLSLLGFACGACIYFLAQPIILIAFGKQWLPAVPVIKILALTIPVQVVVSTSGSFFQTFNRTDLLFKCGIFSVTTNVTAIIFGVALNKLEYLCWALFVSFHLNFFQAYFVLYRHVFHDNYLSFLNKMSPAAICLAILVGWHLLIGHQ